MANQPHSKYCHVYPVVRIDFPISSADACGKVGVVKVCISEDRAEAEANRLNELNASKGCRYIVLTSRLIPE